MDEDRVITLERNLNKRGIKLVNENFHDIVNSIDENKILEQIDAICAFHRAALGFNGADTRGMPNKIGKTVEKYKMRMKNLKRDLKGFNGKSSLNEFESIILKTANIYLSRAEKCIDLINRCNYINLVKRSMRRFEICLGNTYFDNLKKNNMVEIVSLKKCSYNMLEMDGVYLLNKVKKNKNNNIDFESIIKYFCEIEGFNDDSSNFIKALISYPHAYMKCCQRYRLDKKQWDITEYVMNINKAIEQEKNNDLL